MISFTDAPTLPLCNVRTGQPASRITRCVVEPNTSRFTTPFPCTPMTTRSTRSSATTLRISWYARPFTTRSSGRAQTRASSGTTALSRVTASCSSWSVVLRHAQMSEGLPAPASSENTFDRVQQNETRIGLLGERQRIFERSNRCRREVQRAQDGLVERRARLAHGRRDRQHRHAGTSEDFFSDRPEKQPLEPAPAVRAKDQQVEWQSLRLLSNLLCRIARPHDDFYALTGRSEQWSAKPAHLLGHLGSDQRRQRPEHSPECLRPGAVERPDRRGTGSAAPSTTGRAPKP